MKYIADYSAAGFVGDESSGNFLAIHAAVSDDVNSTITVEIVNGVHGPATLDADGLIVCRIADKDTQSIKVTATADGYSTTTKVYTLTDLVCLNA